MSAFIHNNAASTIAKPAQKQLLLDCEWTIHGQVVEVKGRTTAGANVMIDGEEAPAIQEDGNFTYFTPPLPAGLNSLAITAQDSSGLVVTKRLKVNIE